MLPGQSAAAVRSGSSAAVPAAAVAPAAGAAAQDGPPPLDDGRPTRAELCTCEVCGFEAALPADLLAHLKQQHAAEPELARRLEAQRWVVVGGGCCVCRRPVGGLRLAGPRGDGHRKQLGWRPERLQGDR